MWDLPRPGLEPVSPALAGGFLTTAPPRKPCISAFKRCHWFHLSSCIHQFTPLALLFYSKLFVKATGRTLSFISGKTWHPSTEEKRPPLAWISIRFSNTYLLQGQGSGVGVREPVHALRSGSAESTNDTHSDGDGLCLPWTRHRVTISGSA